MFDVLAIVHLVAATTSSLSVATSSPFGTTRQSSWGDAGIGNKKTRCSSEWLASLPVGLCLGSQLRVGGSHPRSTS